MIININSGSSGWGNYVLYGTKKKPRDNSKVELLDGDISLGDYYSKNNKYEDSYYTVVLGFKGKPSKEVIEGAYNDFKEHFFKGFKEDEYHIDAVIHYDTDDTHIHARIPKQNLLTNTHLQLYYDKIDRSRKELIQDYISLKYGFEIARETNKEIVKEQSHEYINKWREERNQEPFDFSKKKGKDLAEKQINSYISDLITSNMIEKQEDIKTVLEELDLEVIKFDRDIKKDFAYVTVQNDTGKMRVKGEFYDGEFFSYNAKDRRTQIESNQRIKEHTEPTRERFERVSKQLNKANEKRFNRVTELFRASRERAINEIKTTTSKAIEINRQSATRELGNNGELTKSTDNQNISNSSNIRDNNRGNINHNDKTLSNTEWEPRSTDNRSINGDKSRTVQQLEEQSRESRERNRTATSNENSKQAINTKTERVASTTDNAERVRGREVYIHQGQQEENNQERSLGIRGRRERTISKNKGLNNDSTRNTTNGRTGTRGQNLHEDRGLANEISRTTTYERAREVRRKRAETLRETRKARTELYKSITETAESLREQSLSNSRELHPTHRNTTRDIQQRVRTIEDEHKQVIQKSESHIRQIREIEPTINQYARFKERVTSYIETARSYISNTYQDLKDRYSKNFIFKQEDLETSFAAQDSKKDILGREMSFKDLEMVQSQFDISATRDIQQEKQREQERQQSQSYSRGYSGYRL